MPTLSVATISRVQFFSVITYSLIMRRASRT